jgi:hypothetical protein
MENSSAATAIALIVVLSFAVDRIVAGLLFALSLNGRWRNRFPDPASVQEEPAKSSAERKEKLVYFVLAATLCIGILAAFQNVRIIKALGMAAAAPAEQSNSTPATTGSETPTRPPTEGVLDFIITGLILMGGAERIAAIIKVPGAGGGEKPGEHPVHITGKLTLEEPGGKKAAGS